MHHHFKRVIYRLVNSVSGEDASASGENSGIVREDIQQIGGIEDAHGRNLFVFGQNGMYGICRPKAAVLQVVPVRNTVSPVSDINLSAERMIFQYLKHDVNLPCYGVRV